MDTLVNNAGIFELGDRFEVEDEAWKQHFAVSFMAGMRLSRSHLPGMERAGWDGCIHLVRKHAEHDGGVVDTIA